jgi:iron complex outermembrane receptor protein
MRTWGGIAAAVTAVMTGVGPAVAVDDVGVTAQRREGRLHEVPLPVSAFDAASIAERQIDTLADIGQHVPNLQIYTAIAGGQAVQIHSRGASARNPGFNLAESPVGIYRDGVYFGRLASANLLLPDVERIEVLRGPQGTLYGRNTIAGAIKVISRMPGDEPWINATLGYGNYDTLESTASVGGPLVRDSLAGSLSLLFDRRYMGWQANPATDGEPGEHENKAGRVKLRWHGRAGLDAVLAAWGAELENDGYNGVPYAPFNNPAGPDENFLPAPDGGGAPLGRFYDNFSPEGANYGDSDQHGADLTLSWTIGGATLRSITGYASIEDRYGYDLAGGGYLGIPGTAGLLIASDSDFDQVSEELQFLGTARDDRLEYLLGVSYVSEDGSQLFAGDLSGPAFAEDIRNQTDSYAAFADGTLRLTDRFSFTVGVRWTKDEKEYSDDCTGPLCFDDSDATTPTPGTGSVSRSDDWDETSLRAGVTYDIDAGRLAYLSFAQGFQAGGYRAPCFGDLSSDDPGTPGLEGCGGTPFGPQTVDSFELGYKASLRENRLRLAANVFYAMYDDLQQAVLPAGGDGTSFAIANAGSVDVHGAEIEIGWSPTDTINMYASAGYQESDFGNVVCGSPQSGFPQDCTDPASPRRAAPARELASHPQFETGIGFDYTVPVSDWVRFFYGMDLLQTEEYFADERNLVKIDGYTRLNGFLGIGDTEETWQVVLAARNIRDKENNVSGLFMQNVTNVRTPLSPAELMLTFRVSY